MLGLLILMSCLLIGELLATFFSGWLAPPIAGFICLFFFLMVLEFFNKRKKSAFISNSLLRIEEILLPHFTFFLLPVVTGTWFFWSSYGQGVERLILVLVFSTLLVIACIGGSAQFFLNRDKR